jgi:hypothetical protein
MKFVVYYESFYIYDEIVIDYSTLRYHKKRIQYDGHLKKISTPAWKIIFLTQKLILAQLVKKFPHVFWPRRVQTVLTVTSLPYSEYSPLTHPSNFYIPQAVSSL